MLSALRPAESRAKALESPSQTHLSRGIGHLAARKLPFFFRLAL